MMVIIDDGVSTVDTSTHNVILHIGDGTETYNIIEHVTTVLGCDTVTAERLINQATNCGPTSQEEICEAIASYNYVPDMYDPDDIILPKDDTYEYNPKHWNKIKPHYSINITPSIKRRCKLSYSGWIARKGYKSRKGK